MQENKVLNPSNSVSFSLLVHDERYSKFDLIVNSELFKGSPALSIGDLVQIHQDEKRHLILKVAAFTEPNSTIQISIALHIANLYDFAPRSLVRVKKITDLEAVSCSVLEISFRDQYIGRSDMWQLKMSLINSPVHVGKKVSSLGVRGQVKGMYVNGIQQSSGYVRENTRVIFRSESAKFFIFIQMSKEMWEFAEDGEMFLEKCVFGFLPDLFARWKNGGCNHVVSIVLFARVVYPPAVFLTSTFDRDASFHRDVENRPCRDFYNVVVDWESRSDWTSILVALKKQVIQFQKEILQQKEGSTTILSGSNSSAAQGNILEAINIALNPFDKHYIDRDLSRTGLSIVIITPSTGIFQVDKKMCRMTTQRMIDSGISLDLVCLMPPPLHSVPLFQFASRDQGLSYDQVIDNQNSGVSSFHNPSTFSSGHSGFKQTSQPPTLTSANALPSASGFSFNMLALDHLYMDDSALPMGRTVTVYLIPDWIDCSFWARSNTLYTPGIISSDKNSVKEGVSLMIPRQPKFTPRCKMYEIQMGVIEMGLSGMNIPDLDIFELDQSPPLSANTTDSVLNPSDTMISSLSVSFSNSLRDPSVLCAEYDTEVFKVGHGVMTTFGSGGTLKHNSSTVSLSRNSNSGGGSGGTILKNKNSWGRVSMTREESKSPEHRNYMGTSFDGGSGGNGSIQRKLGSSSSVPKTMYGSFAEKWARDGGLDRQSRIKRFEREREQVASSAAGGGGGLVLAGEEEENLIEYSSSIEPIKIRGKNSFGNRGGGEFERSSYSNESASPGGKNGFGMANINTSKFSPSKTPTKQLQLLRHNYVNPFRSQKNIHVCASDRRWEHIYPKWFSHNETTIFTNWKSLCFPACLPLTIEYFPTPEELSEYYLEYTYTVSPAYDEVVLKNSKLENLKIESLLIELISQRLAQGFQLIVAAHGINESKQQIVSKKVGKSNKGANIPVDKTQDDKRLFSISKPYFLSLGDHVHRLFYDASGNNVEVKRYTRKLNYNNDPISYSCYIWGKHMTGYAPRSVAFSFPALSSYNWNYLDHLISGYQDQMTDALRYWRIRFLLIPLETAPSSFVSSNTSGADKLDEEEERIVGFTKFMDMIEKMRYISPEEKKVLRSKVLDIQLTTLNLSSLVGREDVHSLLPEAFLSSKPQNDIQKSSDSLSTRSAIDVIAKAILRPPPFGLSFQDRHWRFKVYENVITGEELINWIIQHFSDVDAREHAIEIGNSLIDGGVIEHVKKTHKLLDGFYFYRLCTTWAIYRPDKSNEGSPISPHKRFQSVKQIALDLDPQKKSTRQEIAFLHYDTTHNTNNCYHFQLHWLVCTARLIEDMFHSWARMAEKCGFKLVEAPGGQASALGSDNPFQSLISIELAQPPPKVDDIVAEISSLGGSSIKLPQEWFEREFVKSFNFILDTESDRFFLPDSRGFSYQRKEWPNTQYVHRSGVAFIQILPDQKGFLWVNNRLHLANAASKIGGLSSSSLVPVHPDVLRDQFESYCKNKDLVVEFWHNLKERLFQLHVKNGDNIEVENNLMIID